MSDPNPGNDSTGIKVNIFLLALLMQAIPCFTHSFPVTLPYRDTGGLREGHGLDRGGLAVIIELL